MVNFNFMIDVIDVRMQLMLECNVASPMLMSECELKKVGDV